MVRDRHSILGYRRFHRSRARATRLSGLRVGKGPESNAIDLWSNRIAAWSQLAVAALLVIGYFYTVRPVFQRDVLEEEVAKLTLDKESVSHDIEDLNREKQQAAQTISELGRQLNETVLALKSTKALDDKISASLIITTAKLHSIESQLSAREKALFQAQWHYFVTSFYTVAGIVDIQQTEALNPYEAFTNKESLTQFRSHWPNPQKEMTKTLNWLQSNKDYSSVIDKSMFTNFNNYLSEHGDDLKCVQMDFDAMAIQYNADIKQADAAAEAELPNYLQKVISENTKPNTVVEITDDFRADSLRTFKANKEFAVDDRYAKILSSAQTICSNKVFDFFGKFEKSVEAAQSTAK